MNTYERREGMVRILRSGERTTIPKLAIELSASISTIHRDLTVLTVERGYPINTQQGRAGGVFMQRCGRKHLRILSEW